MAYDGVKPGCDDGKHLICLLGLILLLLLLLLLLFLLLAKRMKVTLVFEGGTVTALPKDWEFDGDRTDAICRRFRWRAELELPQPAVEPPEALKGRVIVGWEPEPPEKVAGSMELRCVWSEGVPEKLPDLGREGGSEE